NLPGKTNAADVDPAGSLYFTGYADVGFPVTTGTEGGSGAFIAKLNTSGTLAYATLINGENAFQGFDISVDAQGNAWVMGGSGGPGQSTTQYFLSKFNTAGVKLLHYGSFLPSSLATDSAGNLIV